MKKNNKLAKAKQEGSLGKIGLYGLTGLLCGTIVFMAIFCLLALLMCKTDISPALLPTLTIAAACFAVAAASFVFARLMHKKGLLLGLLLGVAMFLLLWGVGALQGSTLLTGMAATKGVAMACAGALGGYFGLASAEKKKKLR